MNINELSTAATKKSKLPIIPITIIRPARINNTRFIVPPSLRDD